MRLYDLPSDLPWRGPAILFKVAHSNFFQPSRLQFRLGHNAHTDLRPNRNPSIDKNQPVFSLPTKQKPFLGTKNPAGSMSKKKKIRLELGTPTRALTAIYSDVTTARRSGWQVRCSCNNAVLPLSRGGRRVGPTTHRRREKAHVVIKPEAQRLAHLDPPSHTHAHFSPLSLSLSRSSRHRHPRKPQRAPRGWWPPAASAGPGARWRSFRRRRRRRRRRS